VSNKEKEYIVEKVDLSCAIQEAISRSAQNRIGAKPPVFVTLAPVLAHVPWQNQTAAVFVRRFLYETLLTSDAGAAVKVSLRRRALLRDLAAFVGVTPSYWIQLRVAGRGIRVAEQLIDELFDEIGLRSEEWLGIAGSRARLAIFGSIDAPTLKMAFSIESTRNTQKCDLLLPITDGQPPFEFVSRVSEAHAAQL
jgi:hypothetical protein